MYLIKMIFLEGGFRDVGNSKDLCGGFPVTGIPGNGDSYRDKLCEKCRLVLRGFGIKSMKVIWRAFYERIFPLIFIGKLLTGDWS